MGENGKAPADTAQRRRTRKAIVGAAAELLAQGQTPSMAEVAEAADVSRRTVYMYFPTPEQLLIDAALQSITHEAVDSALNAASDDDDVENRVEAMTRAVQRLFVSTEQEGRALIRLTVATPSDTRAAGQPKRGYRRVEWIDRALAPLRGKIDDAGFERLVSALAMVIGWEALIVARDVRALSLGESEEVSAWAARALVKAALDDAGLQAARVTNRSRARVKK